jgi:hypothetical protein
MTAFFKEIFHLRIIVTGSGPTQASVQWARRDILTGMKRLEREAGHSPISSTEVKNGDWDSSVDKAMEYALDGQGTWVLFPVEFSPNRPDRLWSHQSPRLMDTEGCCHGDKASKA